MNAKRWFALLGAAVLFLVSIVIQVGSTMATSDFEKLFAFGEFEETVIEEGSSLNKIAVIPLDGIIMDTGGNQLVADTYDHQQFLTMLDEAAEDEGADIYSSFVRSYEECELSVDGFLGNMAASGCFCLAARA